LLLYFIIIIIIINLLKTAIFKNLNTKNRV